MLSLIFVGLEISQNAEETSLNTKAVQVNAYQALIAELNEFNQLVLTEPGLSDVQTRILNNEEPGDEEDLRKFQAYGYFYFRQADMAYHQYENGLIDESRLINMLGPLRQYLRSDFGANHWASFNNETSLSPDFGNYVETMIRSQFP